MAQMAAGRDCNSDGRAKIPTFAFAWNVDEEAMVHGGLTRTEVRWEI